MPLIDKDDAFALLAGWRDRGAFLRVRAELFPAIFDLEGTIEKVDSPVVALDVKDRGNAVVLLKDGWHFATGGPESQRGNIQDAVGRSSSNKKQYEFGKTLVASKRDGSRHCVLFMEILGQIIE
ncbi:MAG: hypothetical protein ABSD61_07030 [Terracidiphilus sp.]|jgi:hypothetical protein